MTQCPAPLSYPHDGWFGDVMPIYVDRPRFPARPSPVLDPEADADRVYQLLIEAMEAVR